MNIQQQINRYGYKNAALDLLVKAAYRIAKVQLFYCFTLSPDDMLTSTFHTDTLPFTFGFMELGQVLDLIKPDEMTMTHSFAEQAYTKGDRCFGVIDGDNLAHFSWYATSPTYVVSNLEFHFPSDKVYMYNAFTNPRYRGKKLYPLAVMRALKDYYYANCYEGLTLIEANNFSSISAVKQIGFSYTGCFLLLNLKRDIVFSSNKCARYGLRLVPARS